MERSGIRTFTFTEVARDEAAFTKTINLAGRAISETFPSEKFPIMSEKRDRVVPLDRIHIQPLHDIKKLEQQHKPCDDILLYRAVISAGMSEEEAKARLYTSFQGAVYYLDLISKPTPSLCIAEEALQPLFFDDAADRTAAAIRLGENYIHAMFKALIEPQETLENVHSWIRLIAKDYLQDGLLKDLQREHPNLDGKLMEGAKQGIFNLLDTDIEGEIPRFVALGGKLMVLLPGQTLATAEFSIGQLFDRDVRRYLAMPVLRRFYSLMEVNLMLGRMKVNLSEDVRRTAIRVESMLKPIGMRERDTVLEPYLTSDLWLHILANAYWAEMEEFWA